MQCSKCNNVLLYCYRLVVIAAGNLSRSLRFNVIAQAQPNPNSSRSRSRMAREATCSSCSSRLVSLGLGLRWMQHLHHSTRFFSRDPAIPLQRLRDMVPSPFGQCRVNKCSVSPPRKRKHKRKHKRQQVYFLNGVESCCTKVRFDHSTPLQYYTNVNVNAFLYD